MTHATNLNGGRDKPSRDPSENPYCSFKDDRERRIALVSRDLRIVVIRLLQVTGLVALFAPVGSLSGAVARIIAGL